MVLSPDMAGTYTIPDVEILRVGRWNDHDYTLEELDEIAEAHEELRERGILVPRITLDHDEDGTRRQGDGGPSFGFVDRVRRVGDRLLATLIKVPALLAKAIERENYSGRSVEVWWRNAFGGREYPSVLTALTFLGGDLPAVDGLADIERLYEEPSDELVAALSKPVSGAQRHVAVMSSAALSKEKRMSPEILKALGLEEGATDEAVLAAIEAMKAPVEPEPVEEPAPEPVAEPEPAPESAELSKAKTEAAQMSARLAKLELELETERGGKEVDALIVAGKLAPAQRADWLECRVKSPTVFAKLAKGLPTIVDTRETGHSLSAEHDEFALTPEQKKAADAVGITHNQFKAQLMRNAGKPVPAALLAED